MRAKVYALLRRNGDPVEWRITLHSRVDVEYWARLYRDGILVWIEPECSLGQAIVAARALNKASIGPSEVAHGKRVLSKTFKQVGMSDTWVVHSSWNKQPLYEFFMVKDHFMFKSNDAINEQMEMRCGQLVNTVEGRQLHLEELATIFSEIAGTDKQFEWASLLQLAYLQEDIELCTGVEICIKHSWWTHRTVQFRCNRCGSDERGQRWADCPFCKEHCPYCEQCLTMGRSRFCGLLVRGKVKGSNRDETQQILFTEELELSKWGLSPAQTEAVRQALDYMSTNKYLTDVSFLNKRRFLLWAVTGAGKTEMLFPLIAQARAHNKRVLVATPRRDVVLELLPRLQKAFVDEEVVGLYGGSTDSWRQAGIVVSTTHQVMRFYRSFELVVIDEVDAFPFHNSPMLEYATRQAGGASAYTVLLSATPPIAMQREANRGRLAHAKVPVRYHRRPLPIPNVLRVSPVTQWLTQRKLPTKVIKVLRHSLERGAQLFVFVSRIKHVEPLVSLLQVTFSGHDVAGTSSGDPLRVEKVQQFREKRIRLLVTTTILERGVTIPRSDVFITDADNSLFDAAALIQMAGRAGRSHTDPAGFVYFCTPSLTTSQKSAIRQLKSMNRWALKNGYLAKEES